MVGGLNKLRIPGNRNFELIDIVTFQRHNMFRVFVGVTLLPTRSHIIGTHRKIAFRNEDHGRRICRSTVRFGAALCAHRFTCSQQKYGDEKDRSHCAPDRSHVLHLPSLSVTDPAFIILPPIRERTKMAWVGLSLSLRRRTRLPPSTMT